jgi:hypothetical protein
MKQKIFKIRIFCNEIFDSEISDVEIENALLDKFKDIPFAAEIKTELDEEI